MDRLGPYLIERPLGEGGMGAVYLARHVQLDRLVALKLVDPRLRGDPELLARFRREAETAARLVHPTLVRVYDYGQIDDVPYLAMEYVPGVTLARALERDGAWQPARVLSMVRELLDALAVMHEAGLVHRDVTPSNVLLDDAGRVRLIDLGLARPLAGIPLTSPGMILGTPGYVPPEAILGHRQGGPGDIWQTGLLAREAATGAAVFPGLGVGDLLARICNGPPPRAPQLTGPGAPALRAFVVRALALEPAARWPDARSALADVERLMAEEPPRHENAPSSRPTVRALRPALEPLPGPLSSSRRVSSYAAPMALFVVVALVLAPVLTPPARRSQDLPSPGATPDIVVTCTELVGALERRVPDSDVKGLRTKMRHRLTRPREVAAVLSAWRMRYQRDFLTPEFGELTRRFVRVRDRVPDDPRIDLALRSRLVRAIESLEDLNHLLRDAFGGSWPLPVITVSGGWMVAKPAPPAGLVPQLVLSFGPARVGDPGRHEARDRSMIVPGPSLFYCGDDPLLEGTAFTLPKRVEFVHPLHPTGGQPVRTAWIGVRIRGGRLTEKLVLSLESAGARTMLGFARGTGDGSVQERWHQVDARPFAAPGARLKIAFEYRAVAVVPVGITLDWLQLVADTKPADGKP